MKSVPGEGTSFTIKIPLTLAIVSALIVEAGGDRFAIPQLAVVELVRAQSNSEHRIERIKDTPVLRLRNKLLPLDPPQEAARRSTAPTTSDAENGFIVVTQVGNQTFGIVVDGVFHTEEIVVKPMSSKLRHITMFSGNTILGDGSVIMIIDPNGIAQSDRHGRDRQAADEASATAQRRPAGDKTDVAAGVPRRLAAAEGGAALAGHAARGDRLQEDRALQRPPPGAVPRPAHAAGPRQRRGARASTEGAQPLLVFSDDGRSMGLVVDEIVDIVEDRLDIEVGERHAGRPRLGGDQGPGDRDHRRRPLPAARLRGLVPPQGDAVRAR